MTQKIKNADQILHAWVWGLFFSTLGIYIACDWHNPQILALSWGIILLTENLVRKFWHLSISPGWIVWGVSLTTVGLLPQSYQFLSAYAFIGCGLWTIGRYGLSIKKP